jgi:hypothetical protein
MRIQGDFPNFDHPVSEMFHFPLTREMEGRFFPLLTGDLLKQ